jgi:hypothetical protein
MGVALGWVAFALAGVAAAPHPERQPQQITYTVKYVQTEGLGWREVVFTRLKPVSRQGAATIWTVPRDATTQLVEQVIKHPTGAVLQAPKITAFGGVAASVHSRSNHKLVTQVGWNGDDHAAEAATENVRVGWHTTMVGRKLDQGILVQVVLEDTQIRAVHHVNLPAHVRMVYQPESLKPESTPKSEGAAVSRSPVVASGTQKAAGLTAYAYSWKAKKAESGDEKCAESEDCCEATECTSKDREVRTVAIDVPEIGSQEVAGEWLIPNGECLLVSFGAFTVADKDGKAIVKERLAIIGAEETTEATAFPRATALASPGTRPMPIYVAPMTTPPPIGRPVPAPVVPLPPVAGGPAPTPLGALPLPVPAVPSRSFPQGVHADGKIADLPKLPDDEADDATFSSESAEPLPSPQTKQPIPAKPSKPATKPTADGGATKAEFVAPKAPSLSLTSFFPTSTGGMQFLLPIKPFTLKLPFNQKLQIEILGKVVADTETR